MIICESTQYLAERDAEVFHNSLAEVGVRVGGWDTACLMIRMEPDVEKNWAGYR
jgi:hypothetical protein